MAISKLCSLIGYRMKPKEKYVRLSMKEIRRNLGGLPKIKELWRYVVNVVGRK